MKPWTLIAALVVVPWISIDQVDPTQVSNTPQQRVDPSAGDRHCDHKPFKPAQVRALAQFPRRAGRRADNVSQLPVNDGPASPKPNGTHTQAPPGSAKRSSANVEVAIRYGATARRSVSASEQPVTITLPIPTVPDDDPSPCPNGSENNATGPYAKNVHDVPNSGCPPASKPHSDDPTVCIASLGPPTYCPPDTFLYNGTCRAAAVVPKVPICPHGSILVSPTTCAVSGSRIGAENATAFGTASVLHDTRERQRNVDSTRTQQEHPTVPPAFNTLGTTRDPLCLYGTLSADKTQCIRHSRPKRIVCPKGFRYLWLRGCLRTHSVRPVFVCPDGMHLAGGHCQSEERSRWTSCPVGYHYNSVMLGCELWTRKILAPCPDGYRVAPTNRHRCQPLIPSLARGNPVKGPSPTAFIRACPTGFTLDNTDPHLCVADAKFICPFTPSLRPSGATSAPCLYIFNSTEVCPSGSTLRKNECVVTRTAPPVCSGANGICFEALPAHWLCPEGTTLFYFTKRDRPLCRSDCNPKKNAVCDLSLSALPKPQCPSGFTYDGQHACVAYSPRVCPFGTFDVESKLCKEEVQLTFTTQCPTGTTRIGRNCFRKLRIPLDPVCPPDSIYNQRRQRCEGQSFIVRRHRLSAPIKPGTPCPTGILSQTCDTDGDSVRDYKCPDGSSQVADGRLGPPESDFVSHFVTPQGPAVPWDVTGASASVQGWCRFILPPLVIEDYNRTRPRLACPPSATPYARHCVRTDTAIPLTVLCAEGEGVYDGASGSCVSSTPTHYRTARQPLAIPPLYQCPPNTTKIADSRCLQLGTASTDPRCPLDAEQMVTGNSTIECIKRVHIPNPCPPRIFPTRQGSSPETAVLLDSSEEQCV